MSKNDGDQDKTPIKFYIPCFPAQVQVLHIEKVTIKGTNSKQANAKLAIRKWIK